MTEMDVILREIAIDGLPDMSALVGRVAFVFDGCVVSGWPLIPSELDDPSYEIQSFHEDGDTLWEANSDVGNGRPFSGVRYWIEFPEPIHTFAPYI